jgi:hypothetical protein
MSNSVLVVAFDGADKEKIDEMDLNNLEQKEYGTIDNNTGVFKRSTTELFTSFITGETYEEHGVKGLARWNNKSLSGLENFAEGFWVLRKFKGLRNSFYEQFTPFTRVGYDREFYPHDTLFEKIEKSKWLDVPGYKPTLKKGDFALQEHGISEAERQQNVIAEYKRDKLLALVEEDYDFIMAHFHKIDHFHHWFWEVGNEEKAWEAYREADDYAGKVKNKALENGFDYVIFMSDHGFPTESQHNENAFYSCNKELFEGDVPHITEFHDKILELVDTSGPSEEKEDKGEKYSNEEEEEVKSRLEDLGYM